MESSQPTRGFTLIEIIVSVTLLLLLTGLFIANYTGFNDSQTVKKAASDLITNLKAVRTTASSGVKPVGCDTLVGYTVSFPTASSYTTQASCDIGLVGAANSFALPVGVTFSPIPQSFTFYALDRGASIAQTIHLMGFGTPADVSVFASGVVSDFVASPTP